MSAIITTFMEAKEFRTLCAGLDKNLSQQMVFGISGSQKSVLLASIAEYCQSTLFVLTAGEHEAQMLVDDIASIQPQRPVYHFSVYQLLPYSMLAHGREVLASRLKVLTTLSQGLPMTVVASVEGFMRRLSSPEVFQEAIQHVMVGQQVELNQLQVMLSQLGYERVDLVEGRGQFSVRGGILDVFPSHCDTPFRLEFFDDEVDSIRHFSPDNQRSLDKVQEIWIAPASELVLNPSLRTEGLRRIQLAYEKQRKKIARASSSEARKQLEETMQAAISRMETGLYFSGMEQFLPYFYQQPFTLADYLPPGIPFILDDPIRIQEVVEVVLKERMQVYDDLLGKGKVLPEQVWGYITWEEMMACFQRFQLLSMSHLPRQPKFLKPLQGITFPFKSIPAFLGRMDVLLDEVRHWKKAGYGVALLMGNENRTEQLLTDLKDGEIDACREIDLQGRSLLANVMIGTGFLTGGFEFPSGKLVVVTEKEIYGQSHKLRRAKIANQTSKMDVFTDLKVGDYVVHVNHGIGRYLGLMSLDIDGIHKDYLQLKYAGEDKLYVPTDQVGLLQKYLGSEADAPKLSKLGGVEWHRAKNRVKEAVREMAGELLALYANRETLQGFAFNKDTVWQKEFEANFPYEETPDQLKAIQEVKKDMERSRPMDRLLCGDVGYGKTEVALRAAFKAVMDGKQVAVLVPTTILAQQHYKTFQERFALYPVKVEMLSRFRTPKEQRNIVANLAVGNIDIVIGTHRLVQEDVHFKDLGLVVVDEEQRFGVSHKEKLKQLKNNVDVLTLTATPIPRTLHMSLVGVRDTSILETPPENRFPVQTYVLEEDPLMIREAIQREIGRNGQVFFVHNRIAELDRIALWLSELVPQARLDIGHGQMREDELEQVMLRLMQGETDVLICTTIIESGLDISNVNTLIVKDANHMGLAQLYQLRGRVGRSNKMAYAYFTYRQDRVLNEVAEKRLAAIKEFTEFGSGYKIAMRDLEIRGAGNLLGPEQHGHIAAVGFDMYCRLLEDAVREAKGEETFSLVDTSIELPVEAYLPDDYVPDGNQKVELYRRISHFYELSEIDDVEEEMVDRFGDLPKPAKTLLRIASIKIAAGRLGVKALAGQAGYLKFQFREGHGLTGEKLVEIAQIYKNRLKFNHQGNDFEIKLKAPDLEKKMDNYLETLERFLQNLAS